MKKTALIFISILIIFLLFGCGNEAKLESGFGYTFTPQQIMMGVRSQTDTFTTENVCFDLYYGLHDIGYNEKYNCDPKNGYMKNGYETVLFGLYVCDNEHSLDVCNDMEISDYRVIDNHYFIKSIPESVAFTDDYGFTMSYLKGISYNHSEMIAIPSELFSEETGSFAIKLIAFYEPLEEGDNYYTSTAAHISVRYQLTNSNTVKLVFD